MTAPGVGQHPGSATPLLALRDVSLSRDGQVILDRVTWEVAPGEHWVILGRNGSGKTSIVRIAALYLHPSIGEVIVLGERLGHMDVRRMRTRIGLASSALAGQLRRDLPARDVVMTAKHAALEPWWHAYSAEDRRHAEVLLAGLGVGQLADRPFATLSSGEQQRVQLARTLMIEPAFVLLDEPTAGLDLGGREGLVTALSRLVADAGTPPFVLVTHHVDEIPPGFTHVVLLSSGRVLGQGPIDTTLTESALSECFGVPLTLEHRRDGRFSAWARPR